MPAGVRQVAGNVSALEHAPGETHPQAAFHEADMVRVVTPSPDHVRLSSVSEPPKKKYGCLMALLPDDVTKQIVKWCKANIEERHLSKGGWEGSPHVTIKYGFIDDVTSIIKSFTSAFDPFPIKLGTLSLFKGNDDGDVLKIDVEAHTLRRMNRCVTDSFNCFDKYPEYKPHLTLAYIDPNFSSSYTAMKPPFLNLEVFVNELEYSTAEKKRTRIDLSKRGKALSWLSTGMGGALVKPARFPKTLAVGPSTIKRKHLDWFVKAGFTGQKEDKLGRKICYSDGKRVSCGKPPKTSNKPASAKDPKQEKPSYNQKPQTENATEQKPEKLKHPKKKPQSVKPAASVKPTKPTVENVKSNIGKFLESGNVTPDSARGVLLSILSLTVVQIGELKKQLGLKASGNKQQIADKLAAQIIAKVTSEKPSKSEESRTQSGKETPQPKNDSTPKSASDIKKDWPKDSETRRLSEQSEQKLSDITNDQVMPKLDSMNMFVLRGYTSHAYERVNAAARGTLGDVNSADEQMVNVIDDIIRKSPKLPPTMTYRGISVPENTQRELLSQFTQSLKDGNPITLKGFASTSIDPSSALKFSSKEGVPLMFEIRATKGVYLEPITHEKGEKELLLPNNGKFRVVGIAESPTKGTGRVKYIQLEQITGDD